MQTDPEMISVAEIGGTEVYLGAPYGPATYGLYTEEFDYDGPGRFWQQIAVGYNQTSERDRLRQLRLQAAQLAGGDIDKARPIYWFLRDDKPAA